MRRCRNELLRKEIDKCDARLLKLHCEHSELSLTLSECLELRRWVAASGPWVNAPDGRYFLQ